MEKDLSNYRFVVKEVSIPEKVRDSLITNRIIVIGLEDKRTGVVIPHPFTDFIRVKYEYMGKSLNSQTIPAYIVCRFLNFIYEQIDNQVGIYLPLKYQGIRGLNLQHGSNYITQLSMKGLKRSTVLQSESILTRFYLYLQETLNISEKFQVKYRSDNKGNQILESIFRDANLQTRIPSRVTTNKRIVKRKDFGENRHELVTHFIQTARKTAPEIALGICLQFYGGLRRGEIVNITTQDIVASSRESLIVQIKDNREFLFPHLKDTKNEYPKRLNYLQSHLAKQTILDNDLVWEVFEEHEQLLEIKTRQNQIKNSKAYFIDKDGKAMSGKVYERRFKKVKKVFLESLLTSGRNKDYIFLNEAYWGTHIGRGVFTNFLMDMGLSITQIAIARGDTNIHSAMDYVDEKLTIQSIKEAVNEINNISTEKAGSIDNNLIKMLWKDGVLKREIKSSYS